MYMYTPIIIKRQVKQLRIIIMYIAMWYRKCNSNYNCIFNVTILLIARSFQVGIVYIKFLNNCNKYDTLKCIITGKVFFFFFFFISDTYFLDKATKCEVAVQCICLNIINKGTKTRKDHSRFEIQNRSKFKTNNQEYNCYGYLNVSLFYNKIGKRKKQTNHLLFINQN